MVDKVTNKGILYYEIRPTERLYKQVMGLLFYMNEAYIKDKNLVLPFFKLGDPLPNTTKYDWYDFNQIFCWREINKAPIGLIQAGGFPDPIIHSDNPSVKDPENIIVLDSTNQLPFGHPLHIKWRKYISINKRIENAARRNLFSALQKDKISQYLAVHWRQDDFLKVRPHVTFTAKELVEFCKEKIKEFDIKNVYISTDSTNKEDLDYIDSNLPTFKFPDIENFDNIEYAIIESIICSSSDLFIGTSHSLYTSNIIGERNKLNIEENKSIIFNK